MVAGAPVWSRFRLRRSRQLAELLRRLRQLTDLVEEQRAAVGVPGG
ncbi:hypothetical protein [Longispora urticae]